MNYETEQINIAGEPTADPQVCKFSVDRPLYPEGTVNCTSREAAKDSPLLEALFAINGVREVLVYGNNLTIAKSNDEEWQVLGKQIGAAIRQAVQSGQALISEGHKARLPSEKELLAEVEQLLLTEISPYVASHGGSIEVVDVRGSTVYINMSGGCQGCASASATLKQGIEQIIFERLPQITEVLDITDHTAGKDPYYQ